MIDRVLSDFADRQESVSINISAYDVNSEDFVNWFFRRLSKFLNPARVTIEFVESEEFRESEEFMVFVKRLRQAGCKISVDDFGTGYSSLEEVIRLEPDYIKVDGSIIYGLKDQSKNMILLKTIIFLARQLHLKTIAEFVENEETQALLEENGMDYSQGYLFSKPRPLEDLPGFPNEQSNIVKLKWNIPDGKEHDMKRLISRVVVPMLIVSLLGFVIYFLSSRIEVQMEQSATENVREIVQVIESSIAEIKRNDVTASHRITEFFSSEKDTLSLLKRMQENSPFARVSFVPADSDTGISNRGRHLS